ncbi:MAG TPA: hypothetical protein VIP11_07880, partial [Gemmatimonadaceae bacterium]
MSTSPASTPLSFWRLNLAGWTAYVVAMSLSRIGRFPIGYMIATKTMLGAIGLLLTGFLLRPLYRRTLDRDPSLARVIVVTVAASYVAAALWTVADNVLDPFLVRAMIDARARIPPLRFWLGGALY